MIVATTYQNEEIFQHFGRSLFFKLYLIENGQITESRIISNNGYSHGTLAVMLGAYGIDALICGNIGDGPLKALRELGIQVYAGASGSCDRAVEAMISGELETTDVSNCHHEHDDEGCCGGHSHEGGHCGHHHHHEEGHECCHHGEEDHECCCEDDEAAIDMLKSTIEWFDFSTVNRDE